MSSTPEPPPLLLRDDLPAPARFHGTVPSGGTLLVATEPGGASVGLAVLAGPPPATRLQQLWIVPELRRQGRGRALLELVRAHAAAEGTVVLAAEVPATDAAMSTLAAGTKVLGERLVKPVPAQCAAPGIGWRPLTSAELGPWQEAHVRAYAQDSLERCGGDPGRALEQSRADLERLLPQGLDTPGTRIVVLSSGRVRVGLLWLGHHLEPGLSFVLDVEVEPRHRGRGFGRAAMRVAEVLAREAGDERIGLHVFAGNHVARHLYRTQGYRVVSTTYDLLARSAQTTREDWIE